MRVLEFPKVRDINDLVTITFKRLPLGLKLASDVRGHDAYVTSVDSRRNHALKRVYLPVNFEANKNQ